MAAAALPIEQQPAAPLDRLAMLDEMARQGMRIATLIAEEAEALKAKAAEPSPETIEQLGRLSRAHARVTGSVRLSFILHDMITKGTLERERAAAADRAALAKMRRRQVEHIVERIARDEHDDPFQVSVLTRKVRQSLDHDDLYGDLLARPISELIAMICKDAGMSPEWTKLAQEAWAREEIGSAEVGWPLAGFSINPLIPANAGTQIRELEASG